MQYISGHEQPTKPYRHNLLLSSLIVRQYTKQQCLPSSKTFKLPLYITMARSKAVMLALVAMMAMLVSDAAAARILLNRDCGKGGCWQQPRYVQPCQKGCKGQHGGGGWGGGHGGKGGHPVGPAVATAYTQAIQQGKGWFGGQPAIASANADAKGKGWQPAFADAGALAKNQWGPALSSADARAASWGPAAASAGSKSITKGGPAAAQSTAAAIGGPIATSQAGAKAITGKGPADAKSAAFSQSWGAAISDAKSVAVSGHGPATAQSQATSISQGGGPAIATASSTAYGKH